ncbi:uncharacterized protein J3R85_012000 [Psidium guajava]|nr:uncharacterized protein J3R85_012000 [Psidium guajava]
MTKANRHQGVQASEEPFPNPSTERSETRHSGSVRQTGRASRRRTHGMQRTDSLPFLCLSSCSRRFLTESLETAVEASNPSERATQFGVPPFARKMDPMATQSTVLALTDDAVMQTKAVFNLIREVGFDELEQCDPQIITQASCLGQLPVESSSVDFAIAICKSSEFPGTSLFEEISRVVKPGGTVVIRKALSSLGEDTSKASSALERELLLAGFLEARNLPIKSVASSEGVRHFMVKATKPSWKLGSSFAIKKGTKSFPKVQIMGDDDDLIDEDSLLTEEDLKKPQLPSGGDCEVGSTRKACKNCTCGRAEAEEKVEKLGVTLDQLNNPQSACGNVRSLICSFIVGC